MTRPKIDRLAPSFELDAAGGGRIASWDYKARKNLVLSFAHQADCPSCRAALSQLRQDYPRFQEHTAEVLALVPASLSKCTELQRELKLPFPVLADEGAGVSGRYRESPEPGAALVVLDRYGEAYGRWLAADADALPASETVLSTLRLIELECPECGVPEWF